MNRSIQIRYRERIFCRSCLESSPIISPRDFRVPDRCRSKGHPHPQLHQLKQTLLHAALEETDDALLFKYLCGAANEAAEMAWATAYPLLVFPCLFEEMAQTIRSRFQQGQLQGSEAEFPTEVEEADPEFGNVHPDSGHLGPFPGVKVPPALLTQPII